MHVELVKSFRFEAAHLLPNVPEGHKCRRLHGHSYVVDLAVQGEVEEKSGWLVDFAEISSVGKPVFDVLDHFYLNDIAGLENPTAEVIARWIWDRLKPKLPILESITIRETCTSACVYRGK